MSRRTRLPQGIGTSLRTALILLSVIPGLLAPSPAKGACADWSSHLHWAGTATPPGEPYRIAIEGTHAYVASMTGGFSIIDISDPRDMAITAVSTDFHYPMDVAAKGPFAYVADWGVGLRVVDVRNPANPKIVGTCFLNNIASVTLAGSYAYVTEPVYQSFFIIDVSDPTSPFVLGGLSMPDFSWDTAVHGHYAFVSCSYRGLAVVDILNPEDPVLVDVISTPGIAFGVAADSSHAYVADGQGGLTVLDIKNPLDVTVVGNLDVMDAHDVALSGSLALVAAWSLEEGLVVVDVSTPESPTLAATHRVNNRAEGVAVAGTLTMVADETKVFAYDLAGQPEEIAPIGLIDEGTQYVLGVDVRGAYACAAVYPGGIQVIDVADPASPAILGACWASGNSHAVALDESGRQAAVAAGAAGLHLFNVVDPAHPARMSGVDTPGYAWDVVRSGAYAYVADGASGVQIVRVSDPSAPARIGSLELPGVGTCRHVALSDRYLYAADDQAGLFVIDVSAPTNPVLTRAIAIPGGAVGVVVADAHAYVTGDSLWVVDISDPGFASLVGGVPLPDRGCDLAIANGTLYVSTDWWGVYLYDITRRARPRVIGGIDSLVGYPDGIAVSDDVVYVVTQVRFAALPAQCQQPVAVPGAGRESSDASGLCAVPNPTSGETRLRFSLPVAASSLEILDVAGRRVRDLTSCSLAVTPREVMWDGRDDAGRPVPSGSYFVRARIGGRDVLDRIVVLR